MNSLIIAHYPVHPSLDEKLNRCLDSLTGYDELVLVVNDGIGFGKAFNWGMKVARGNYLFIVSNDTWKVRGDLKDLCDPEAVTTPTINNGRKEFAACFFCLPRWVYEKIGGFDEQFETAYFEDNDLVMRFKEANIPMKNVATVEVKTEGGQTMDHMDRNRAFSQNRERFIRKWGEEALKTSEPVIYDS